MRGELAAAVSDVLARVDRDTPPRMLTDDETDRLVKLAVFVVAARTAVERDGYDREVVVMPQAEAPGRLVGSLAALLAGVEAIGADPPACWRIMDHAGWGCVPDMRRRLLERLHDAGTLTTGALVEATGIPRTTADRALEDLALLGLVNRAKTNGKDTSPWQNSLTESARKTWPTPPEVSDTCI